MANSNGIISAPVSFADVNTVLGTAHTDLATLCKVSQINKWAMYKPESYAVIGLLSLANRKANYFGLTPSQNNKAKVTMYGYGGTDAMNIGDSGYSMANIIAANIEWPYTKPSGGSNSPYRLADFNQYIHSARCPIYGWSDWELYISDLNT